eukprot:g39654.t1
MLSLEAHLEQSSFPNSPGKFGASKVLSNLEAERLTPDKECMRDSMTSLSRKNEGLDASRRALFDKEEDSFKNAANGGSPLSSNPSSPRLSGSSDTLSQQSRNGSESSTSDRPDPKMGENQAEVPTLTRRASDNGMWPYTLDLGSATGETARNELLNQKDIQILQAMAEEAGMDKAKKLKWKQALCSKRNEYGVENLDNDPGPIVIATATETNPSYLCYWCFRKWTKRTQYHWHTKQGVKYLCQSCKAWLVRKREKDNEVAHAEKPTSRTLPAAVVATRTTSAWVDDSGDVDMEDRPYPRSSTAPSSPQKRAVAERAALRKLERQTTTSKEGRVHERSPTRNRTAQFSPNKKGGKRLPGDSFTGPENWRSRSSSTTSATYPIMERSSSDNSNSGKLQLQRGRNQAKAATGRNGSESIADSPSTVLNRHSFSERSVNGVAFAAKKENRSKQSQGGRENSKTKDSRKKEKDRGGRARSISPSKKVVPDPLDILFQELEVPINMKDPGSEENSDYDDEDPGLMTTETPPNSGSTSPTPFFTAARLLGQGYLTDMTSPTKRGLSIKQAQYYMARQQQSFLQKQQEEKEKEQEERRSRQSSLDMLELGGFLSSSPVRSSSLRALTRPGFLHGLESIPQNFATREESSSSNHSVGRIMSPLSLSSSASSPEKSPRLRRIAGEFKDALIQMHSGDFSLKSQHVPHEVLAAGVEPRAQSSGSSPSKSPAKSPIGSPRRRVGPPGQSNPGVWAQLQSSSPRRSPPLPSKSLTPPELSLGATSASQEAVPAGLSLPAATLEGATADPTLALIQPRKRRGPTKPLEDTVPATDAQARVPAASADGEKVSGDVPSGAREPETVSEKAGLSGDESLKPPYAPSPSASPPLSTQLQPNMGWMGGPQGMPPRFLHPSQQYPLVANYPNHFPHLSGPNGHGPHGYPMHPHMPGYGQVPPGHNHPFHPQMAVDMQRGFGGHMMMPGSASQLSHQTNFHVRGSRSGGNGRGAANGGYGTAHHPQLYPPAGFMPPQFSAPTQVNPNQQEMQGRGGPSSFAPVTSQSMASSAALNDPETLLAQCLSAHGFHSVLQSLYLFPNSSQEFRQLFTILSSSQALPKLLVDLSGRQVVTLLLSLCTEGQTILLIQNLRPHFRDIAGLPVGCEAICQILSSLQTVKQLSAFTACMTPHIGSLVQHEVAYKLVVMFLEHCPEKYTMAVDRVLNDQALLQSACTCAPGRDVMLSLLRCRQRDEGSAVALRVASLTLELAQNQFGAPVVGSAIQNSTELVRVAFLRQMEGSYLRLSLNNYSASVVCQCLTVCSPLWRNVIISETSDFNESRQLLTNPSGKRVLQLAMSVANEDQLMRVMLSLRCHLPRLKPKARTFWNHSLRQAWDNLNGRKNRQGGDQGKSAGYGMGAPEPAGKSGFDTPDRQVNGRPVPLNYRDGVSMWADRPLVFRFFTLRVSGEQGGE